MVLNVEKLHTPGGPDISPIAISSCSRTVAIDYTPWMHAVVQKVISDGGLQFERWIHPQMIYKVNTLEYNTL